jgi:WD40 repeat protein
VVRVRDTKTGKLIGELVVNTHQASVQMPDGHNLILIAHRIADSVKPSYKNQQLQLLNAVTGKVVGNPIAGVDKAVLSPDGKMIATIGFDVGEKDRGVRLWEVATGKLRAELLDKDSPSHTTGMAFSPDGRKLCTLIKPGEQPALAACVGSS